MLPTKRRVKKEFFAQIVTTGRTLHGQNFYLKYLDRKDKNPTLFSFVVSSKVRKTSVGRHLLKRKMSAAVETVINEVKPGLFVIFFAKKALSSPPYSEIKKEISALLIKVGALN